MCRAVRCKTCEKTTWSGCGLHVAQVRARVPAEQWCSGHPRSTPDPTTADGSQDLSWFRRLLGHR